MDYEYIFAHLTIILTLAAASGILTGKLKQPIMIGYIVAGVLIGPNGLGLIASQEQVHFYSELGILLLLFVIGMELNIKSFLKMWKIPTLFTVIQVVGSTVLAVLMSHVFGFPIYVSLLTGFFTCLSSTAAIVKVLEYLGESKTDVGHITIGILVAQDIVVVPMMLIIKECGKPLGISIVLELVFAISLVVFMLKYLGKREQIKLPVNHLIPNQELVPVVTLASVFIAATIVTLFGLSEAYGAFLAGLFIGNTQARQNVLNSIKPIQNVLLMVFFLSVGLMFDMKFLFQNWFVVLISLVLVTSWKIFFNSIILRMFSIELAKATSIGIILAQLGEFSLVLATVATQSGIIGTYGQKLIVCITALSLSISPLFIALSKKTRNLSFIGDNSANSIIKVIFSGRFSRLVEILIHRSKNTIKNQIEKIKSKTQEKETITITNNVLNQGVAASQENQDNISNKNDSENINIQENNTNHNQLALIDNNKEVVVNIAQDSNRDTSNTEDNMQNSNNVLDDTTNNNDENINNNENNTQHNNISGDNINDENINNENINNIKNNMQHDNNTLDNTDDKDVTNNDNNIKEINTNKNQEEINIKEPDISKDSRNIDDNANNTGNIEQVNLSAKDSIGNNNIEENNTEDEKHNDIANSDSFNISNNLHEENNKEFSVNENNSAIKQDIHDINNSENGSYNTPNDTNQNEVNQNNGASQSDASQPNTSNSKSKKKLTRVKKLFRKNKE